MAARATPGLYRWTRDRILHFPWGPFETLDRLVLNPILRERLRRIVESFQGSRDRYHELKLPWRRGIFVFGASGCGKSACSRGVARALSWDHFVIPAHEILDSHLLERALGEAVSAPARVIVLDDVDLIIKRMETEDFFTLLDHSMDRADGTFWVATSRHPEDTPKTQLIRPGRLEDPIRLERPSPNLRRELLQSLAGAALPDAPAAPPLGEDELPPLTPLDEMVENTEGLTFAHFEEIRVILARVQAEGRKGESWTELENYVKDQFIAGDRWGGLSDLTEKLNQRVAAMDPRVLMAALDMTDVFRALMDKVIGDAALAAQQQAQQGGGPEPAKKGRIPTGRAVRAGPGTRGCRRSASEARQTTALALGRSRGRGLARPRP